MDANGMEKMYTAIVITCSDQESANAYQTEIKLRQKKSLIHPKTAVLCVVDPKPNIGSGGATLNAIFNVTEHISAIKGYTVISGDVLHDQRILILHMGTTTPYSACASGFLPLPAVIENNRTGVQYSGFATQFDILLQMTINVLAADSPPGFWVCSGDRIISIPMDMNVDWSTPANVRLFTVPMELSSAANQHGVAKIGKDNVIEDIVYKGSENVLKQCLIDDVCVPVVCGIVFFETKIVDKLLNLSVLPPLDNYTYLALDAGSRPTSGRPLASEKEDMFRDDTDTFVLSLFFDILLCMSSNINRNDFLTGKRGGVYGTVIYPDLDKIGKHIRRQTRQVLWDSLRGITLKAETLKDSEFIYMSHDPSLIHDLLLHCPDRKGLEKSNMRIEFCKQASSLSLITAADDDKNNVLVNTMVRGVTVGNRCVLLNSNIDGGGFHIGDNSMIINLGSDDLHGLPRSFQLPDNVVLEALHLKMENELSFSVERILVMFGMHDKLKQDFSLPDSTIFNKSWNDFFKRTAISPAELWSAEVPVSKRCLLNARLFPVYHPKGRVSIHNLLWLEGSYTDRHMSNSWRTSWKLSMSEILDLCNPGVEFAWRRDLYFNIGQKRMEKSLNEKTNICFTPFFQTCITDGYFEQILDVLDSVAKSSTDPAVISRTFACIADVLGAKAGGIGGLRSGPAANYSWKAGLKMVKAGKIIEAVEFLAKLRRTWIVTPDLLVRAARHYEGAFQIQVRKAVATARQFITLTKGDYVPMSTWVTASCPARADIAGTWSDTPPICYEQGGTVAGLALSIDGKKPIGCRVQRIPEPKIFLIIGKDVKIECEQFEDLMNFSQPNIQGALLKAAFFCTELLPLHNQPRSLEQYLTQSYGGGFVLQTWSNLPYGSGLGTSSILAGAIISSLWRVVGFHHHTDSVIHAVLDLEQMLTTGGGWQDQVGGLYPGVKIGSSANKLPLHVKTTSIQLPPEFEEKFEKHLLVVFTGKTRLARNMLQDVLRNWNARSPEIVETAKQLISNAEECVDCLKRGDLEGIGKCLNDCWRHKKIMAHGCEPNVVRLIMEAFRPHVYGQSLVGAGGGGFMIIITKEENGYETLSSELAKLEMADKATVHRVLIDKEGLVVTVDSEVNEEPF